MDPSREIEVDPRVALAAERTALAWVRTGLGLMGLGFVVARFGLFLREVASLNGVTGDGKTNASTIGVVLVGAGVAINVGASFRHVRMIHRLRTGQPFHATARGPAAVGVATGIGGLILVAVLLRALLR